MTPLPSSDDPEPGAAAAGVSGTGPDAADADAARPPEAAPVTAADRVQSPMPAEGNHWAEIGDDIEERDLDAGLAASDPASPAGPSAGVSAADRVQSRASRPGRAARAPRKGLIRLGLLGLVGAAIAVGVVTFGGGGDPGTDLLAHLETSAADFRPDLVTVDASAAERYVLDAFGWPVTVPDLPELQLVGVGEASVLTTPTLDVSMPAFRYDARDGETLVVFVYDYVLLDGAQGALDLPEAVYARLAETPSVDVRRQDGLTFVSWRVRSVVYTAVTEDEEVAEQIARGVSG